MVYLHSRDTKRTSKRNQYLYIFTWHRLFQAGMARTHSLCVGRQRNNIHWGKAVDRLSPHPPSLHSTRAGKEKKKGLVFYTQMICLCTPPAEVLNGNCILGALISTSIFPGSDSQRIWLRANDSICSLESASLLVQSDSSPCTDRTEFHQHKLLQKCTVCAGTSAGPGKSSLVVEAGRWIRPK